MVEIFEIGDFQFKLTFFLNFIGFNYTVYKVLTQQSLALAISTDTPLEIGSAGYYFLEKRSNTILSYFSIKTFQTLSRRAMYNLRRKDDYCMQNSQIKKKSECRVRN